MVETLNVQAIIRDENIMWILGSSELSLLAIMQTNKQPPRRPLQLQNNAVQIAEDILSMLC